uniref:PiggyBac transposable element-derived protein domain-containing protein n=1 Tax=Octopus bimaculoides TaxID=37653 RepID=A0A0L8GMW2_OCTBM
MDNWFSSPDLFLQLENNHLWDHAYLQKKILPKLHSAKLCKGQPLTVVLCAIHRQWYYDIGVERQVKCLFVVHHAFC